MLQKKTPRIMVLYCVQINMAQKIVKNFSTLLCPNKFWVVKSSKILDTVMCRDDWHIFIPYFA